MPYILAVLILLNLGGLGYTICEGLLLADVESVRFHFLCGFATTILIVFTHSLVLFYLIGTGIDIREAVSVDARLEKHFVPLTRELKRRVFPAACLGAVFIIVAALMGAEVHGRLISAGVALDADGGPAQVPLRGVSVWWLHLVVVGLAAVTNLWAFIAEFAASRNNRAAIGEINRLLDLASRASANADGGESAVEEPSESPSTEGRAGSPLKKCLEEDSEPV